jgi:hydroxyacylglutathione hydrolase
MEMAGRPIERGRWPLEVHRVVTGVFQENTWLIRDCESGDTALIDPGQDILDELEQLGLLDGLELTKILLTHAHLDHVWGLRDAHERWPSAPIVMHRDDLDLLRALPKQGAMIGMPIALAAPPEPTHFVAEGETVSLGKRTATVIHTPGHTRGGICFHFDTGDVFVGDMIIAGSVGRIDLLGGELFKMEASLLRLCELPPEVWIHGGHGPQKSLATELRTNHVLPELVAGRLEGGRGFQGRGF